MTEPVNPSIGAGENSPYWLNTRLRRARRPPDRPPFFAAPKSDTGKRMVAIPSMIIPDVLAHRDDLTPPGADALLFTSPTGKPLR